MADESVNTEIAALESEMADTRSWFHNEAGQARYSQLIEARESAATPAALPAVETRKAEIEGVMGTPEYWQDEKMQAEYRALLEPEKKNDESGEPSGELVLGTPEADRHFAVAASELSGRFDLSPEGSQLAAVSSEMMMAEMEGDVLESFNELPDPVQSGLVGFLAGETAIEYTAADDEFYDHFVSTEEGKLFEDHCGEHARGWTSWAMSGLAAIHNSYTSDADRAAFAGFLGELSPKDYLTALKWSAHIATEMTGV